MYMFGDSAAFNLLEVIIVFLIIVSGILKWKLSFWRRYGLPTSSTNGALNMALQRESFGQYMGKTYHEAKVKGLKHIGAYFFLRPTYIPVDPKIIKHILIKDFNNFMDRGMYFNEEKDPLTGHLFNLEGEKWKTLRQKLSPTFTTGQMKVMFQTLVECGEQLNEHLEKLVKNNHAIDIKDLLARFTTDIIGSCAFGIQCNTIENPDAEFRKYGRLAIPASLTETAKFIVALGLPRKLLHRIGFTTTRKDVHKFFTSVVQETVNYREKNNVHRKDFMQLLLELKNKGTLDGESEYINDNVQKLTVNEIAAQAFIFYLAGFETSSTAMTFALYEMALNETIQDKARAEINAIMNKYDKKMTYEGIMEMNYLQKVLDESLRKYPPLSFLDRVCKEDYEVPGTNFILPKGTHVNIALDGIHHDAEYYPDPDKFDPERFTEENKNKRPPCTYFPFGDGPRICIGMRFGIMQAKIGLVSILKDYHVTLHPKTAVPLILDPTSILTTTKGAVYVIMKKITKETYSTHQLHHNK